MFRLSCKNTRGGHSKALPRATKGRMTVHRAKSDDVLDVAIIGGGMGGLSAAVAILRAMPDTKLHIFERATSLRPSGGTVGLREQQALPALSAMGPDVLAAVKSVWIQRRHMIAATMSGEVLARKAIPSYIVAWYDMQQALLSCLPDGVLSLKCELQQVEEKDGVVTVRMKNGQEVRARLVIGSDGNRSVCRRYVQPGNEPVYAGAAVWRFFMPGDNPFVKKGDSFIMTGDGKLMLMQHTNRDGKVLTYCSAFTGYDEDRLTELNQTRYVQESSEDSQTLDSKLARYKEQFKKFRGDMLEHVLKHAVPESVLEHPMYALDPRQPWSKGHVALLGDAAHVMPAQFGQGTPAAFEDALQLALSLKTHGISVAALKEYETERKERFLPIWDAVTAGAMGYYKHKREECNPFHYHLPPTPEITKLYEHIDSYQPPMLASGP